MKITANTIILCIGILLIVGVIWLTRPDSSNSIQSEEYKKIDSVLKVIDQRQIRDSIRNQKADSLLSLVANNNKVISGFVNELNKINNQLDQTLTNINNLTPDQLISLYANQLSQASNK